MASWEGADSNYVVDGMPAVQKIARKPKGVGMELKSVADGDTCCILGLEIHEGKIGQAHKPYEQKFGGGTAFVLRLSNFLFGSGVTVIADSAFSSVKTAEQLLKHGLFFIGIVKTAHRRYPMKYIKQWFTDGYANMRRGDINRIPRWSFIVLKSSVIGTGQRTYPIYAYGWADKRLKTIVCSRGISIDGATSERVRHRIVQSDRELATERYILRVPRPQVI